MTQKGCYLDYLNPARSDSCGPHELDLAWLGLRAGNRVTLSDKCRGSKKCIDPPFSYPTIPAPLNITVSVFRG